MIVIINDAEVKKILKTISTIPTFAWRNQCCRDSRQSPSRTANHVPSENKDRVLTTAPRHYIYDMSNSMAHLIQLNAYV
jgi:hypothetical protein